MKSKCNKLQIGLLKSFATEMEYCADHMSRDNIWCPLLQALIESLSPLGGQKANATASEARARAGAEPDTDIYALSEGGREGGREGEGESTFLDSQLICKILQCSNLFHQLRGSEAGQLWEGVRGRG